MSIAPWDPFDKADGLEERINRLFDDNFPERRGCEECRSTCAWKPQVDIYETDDGLTLMVDLPGMQKKDLSVELRGTILTLSGERMALSQIADNRYLLRERCMGSFQRSFNLGLAVSPEAISARFKDGVLEVRVPKPVANLSKRIDVNTD